MSFQREPELEIKFQLPPSTVTVAAPGDAVAISKKDWRRLQRMVSAITSPAAWLDHLMWAALTFAPTVLLALVPWVAASEQLPPEARGSFAWVGPCMALAGIFSFVLAAVCWGANRGHRVSGKLDVREVLDLMDEIYPEGRVPRPRARPWWALDDDRDGSESTY